VLITGVLFSCLIFRLNCASNPKSNITTLISVSENPRIAIFNKKTQHEKIYFQSKLRLKLKSCKIKISKKNFFGSHFEQLGAKSATFFHQIRKLMSPWESKNKIKIKKKNFFRKPFWAIFWATRGQKYHFFSPNPKTNVTMRIRMQNYPRIPIFKKKIFPKNFPRVPPWKILENFVPPLGGYPPWPRIKNPRVVCKSRPQTTYVCQFSALQVLTRATSSRHKNHGTADRQTDGRTDRHFKHF